MKTLKHISCFTIAALLLVSCVDGNIDMKTEIHEDGSCVRELCFYADSASLVNPQEATGLLKDVFANEKWDKSWTVKDTTTNEVIMEGAYPMTPEQYHEAKTRLQSQPSSNGDTTFINLTPAKIQVCAKREFPTVEEMASELPICINGQQVKAKAILTKKFRWFYTDYVYTESFESFAPQFELSLNDFMDEDAVNYWLTGSPDIFKGYSGFEQKEYLDEMENKFFQYINANMCNDYFNMIADHYELFPDAPMSKEEFVAKGKELLDKRDLLSFNPLETDTLLNVITQYLGIDDYSIDTDNNENQLSQLWSERMERYSFLVLFTADYALEMPGGIVNLNDCGNMTFKDGKLHAQLNGIRLLAPEYTIQASSSVKNEWALWLSLLIGLAAIVLCGTGIWRKMNHSSKL